MNIILYGAEWCKFCQQGKDWLKQNNIEFIYKDIDDQANYNELKHYDATGIPLTIIETKEQKHVIQGLKLDEIAQRIQEEQGG